MVRSFAFLLAIPEGVFAGNQKYTMTWGGQADRCIYCHSNGDCGLYGCDTSQTDQHFTLEKVDPSLIDGRDNGYIIRTYTNQCWASNDGGALFGWSSCGHSKNDGDTFFLTANDKGIVMENAHWRGHCVASNDGNALFMSACQGQTWVFDPPFEPDHGTPITHPEAWWDEAASNNGDLTKSLTTGMSRTDGHSVTHSDQRGFSYAFEDGAEFLGLGMKETLTKQCSHTLSTEVSNSATTTSTDQCTASCHLSDLPDESPGWTLFQWKLRGTATTGSLSAWTCRYLCLPQPMQPRCPPDCCRGINCQICKTDLGCPKALGGVGEYKEKVWLGDTDFYGGDIRSYSGTGDDAWHTCKDTPGCSAYVVTGGQVYLKNVFAAANPTHSADHVAYVMAQTNYFGVKKWWKVFEGVRLGNPIMKIDDPGDRAIVTQQCEEMAGCDAFMFDTWAYYFFDFTKSVSFKGPYEGGFTTYIMEANPWSNTAVTAANVPVVV